MFRKDNERDFFREKVVCLDRMRPFEVEDRTKKHSGDCETRLLYGALSNGGPFRQLDRRDVCLVLNLPLVGGIFN